jgi:hypothetical protein
LVAAVEDVAISDLTRSLAEIKRRSSQFTTNLAALIQTIKVSFKFWYGIDSTNFVALQTMFLSGAAEEWAILDDLVTTTGSQGLLSAFIVSGFPITENIEDAVSIDVELSNAYYESPAGTAVDPSWFTVAGGVSTTTTALP